jgi:hypothetical protein
VIDSAKSEGAVPRSLASKDAATMFLSLIHGLGFQFAIVRLPIKLVPEAERAAAQPLRPTRGARTTPNPLMPTTKPCNSPCDASSASSVSPLEHRQNFCRASS